MEEIKLAKIWKAQFGFCGFENRPVGLKVVFEIEDGTTISSTVGVYSPQTDLDWTWTSWDDEELDKFKHRCTDLVFTIARILAEAKVETLDELIGKVVELVLEIDPSDQKQTLKCWRLKI